MDQELIDQILRDLLEAHDITGFAVKDSVVRLASGRFSDMMRFRGTDFGPYRTDQEHYER